MKYLFVLLAVPFLTASECCNKKKKMADAATPADTTGALPSCFQKIIADQEKEVPPNGPERIEEYLYNGKTVYLLTAPCCDQYNTLYDDACQMLCAPTGGFSGRGDGKCPDFAKTAKLVKLVWTKTERK